MTESMFFLYFFVIWFTIVWIRYVNLPLRMKKKGMSGAQGKQEAAGQMPASANMAMWQTMGD